MKTPRKPLDEAERLQELKDLRLLDTTPEEEFDEITKLAATLCETKFALVSLVDSERQWFKSRHGLWATETPRDISFCGHAILGDDIFIVSDSEEDTRFCDNPLVLNEPHVRFYAGVPLITVNGKKIGTLCVIDPEKKTLNDKQVFLLKSLAKQVVHLFELRLKNLELGKLEQELHEAQSISKIGSWTYHLLTAKPYWSKEHFQIFEIDESVNFETLQKQYWERVHPEDRASLKHLLRKAALEGEDFVTDHRVVFDGGKRIKFVQGICKVTFENGRPVAISGTCRDRTSDVENEGKNRAILESMNEGLLVLNHEGTIIQYNQSALNILGLTGDELVGRDSYDPRWRSIHENGSEFNGEDHPSTVALRTGIPQTGVIMGVMKHIENEIRWLRINAIPTDWHDGRRVVVTFTDISAIRRADEENRFVMETLGIGVWNYDVAANQQYWDKSMYELYEISHTTNKRDLEDWESMLTPESRKLVKEDWKKVLSGEKALSSTYEISTKSGKKKFIGSRARIIYDSDNKPRMMYGINWDRTIETQLEKNLQLERAKALHNAKLASIGQLAAGVGHEINNPLAIISGQMSIAEQILLKAQYSDDMVYERFRRVEKAVGRITNIVKGLRTFARSDDDQLAEFNGHDLVNETVDMLRDLYKQEGIVLDYFGAKEDVMICGNRGRIQQVLVNLISNAKDAVELNTEKLIAVEVINSEKEIVIKVTDNGHGIPDSIREKIFDPFFTTKELNKGTGIGLSLVNTIVKEHDGRLDLKSKLGQGTTFIITLPAKKMVKPSSDVSLKPAVFPKIPCKALIVDDEEDIRDSLQFILSLFCESVTTAADAKEALRLLDEKEIDVILSDVKMPGIDGFKFLDLVREKKQNKFPKFLFLSGGVDMTPEQEEKVDSLTDGFLSKPFKKEIIYRKLQELIQKA